ETGVAESHFATIERIEGIDRKCGLLGCQSATGSGGCPHECGPRADPHRHEFAKRPTGHLMDIRSRLHYVLSLPTTNFIDSIVPPDRPPHMVKTAHFGRAQMRRSRASDS